MRGFFGIPVLFVAAMALFAFPAFARDVEITVEDDELGIPLEGAVILLSDGRRYEGDPDGRAVIFVAPETVMPARISYPGYETARIAIAPDSESIEIGRASCRERV